MAFFGYDPYDYYYTTSPYHHPYTYYSRHQQPAPARRAGGSFPAAEDAGIYSYQHEPPFSHNGVGFFPASDVNPYFHRAPARRAGGFAPAAGNGKPAAAREAACPKAGASRSVSSIPIRFVSSDPELEISRMPVKRALSAEDAVVWMQAAARGFLARKAVAALRAVEREAEEIGEKVAREAEALRGDARARLTVGEQLMRLLFRLDAVRGARELRKTVAKRVLALQDAIDALGQSTVEEAAAESEVTEAAEKNDTEAELPDAAAVPADHSREKEAKAPIEMMEVDGDRAAGVDETEQARDGANSEVPDNADTEGEWEVVTEEPELPAEAASSRQEKQVGEVRKFEESSDGDGMETKKLMEMVAALCEQNAQQCAVIGAMAERVDALERTVRRVEDAERRRQRAKKLKKAGKGSNRNKCFID
ncbi:hypothetical protein PR202_ga21945 [Eleusine coracana subsp. coracana]|uniref:BAG domain-containing protein n=1 Tax=Eleusine coracana subsp. coracana TaxID=191504 RepID=A0AAV5D234_ELECO|nr:hypothetical protein QOZ80_9AG0682660 [Eleusine coracana subsp. coracana]GJN04398.1 hypothetical protein PR202_ga21945 [Eleusine coracana subsp. coracana]